MLSRTRGTCDLTEWCLLDLLKHYATLSPSPSHTGGWCWLTGMGRKRLHTIRHSRNWALANLARLAEDHTEKMGPQAGQKTNFDFSGLCINYHVSTSYTMPLCVFPRLISYQIRKVLALKWVSYSTGRYLSCATPNSMLLCGSCQETPGKCNEQNTCRQEQWESAGNQSVKLCHFLP